MQLYPLSEPIATPTAAMAGKSQGRLNLPLCSGEIGSKPYLDTKEELRIPAQIPSNALPPSLCACGQYAIVGRCSNDETHIVGRTIDCAREWCPLCGEDRSIPHKKRYWALLHKAQQMHDLGVFVLTFGEPARLLLRNKEALRATARAITKVFRDYGYKRGWSRWHWFGDPSCPCGSKQVKPWADKNARTSGIKCVTCGRSHDYRSLRPNYHPHLNVVVDGGYIAPARLEQMKQTLRQIPIAPYVIHYSTTGHVPGKILHRLRYVTRSTFRAQEWAPDMVIELRNFKNQTHWGLATRQSDGHWAGQPVWELKDLSSKDQTDVGEISGIMTGKCPLCDGTLRWTSLIIHGLLVPPEAFSLLDDRYILFDHRYIDHIQHSKK